MANLQKLATRRSEILWFPPDLIKVKPGLNGRDLRTPDNVEHVAAIADSIEANGFMASKPIEFFTEGEDIYLSDGHVRLAAVMLCIERGIVVEKIPCVAEPKGTNDADRILNQSAHNSGKRLTPLEEGSNIKRALALGLTAAEVAKRLGKSTNYVNQALDFQAAPAEIHAMVKAGEVSSTLAAQIVRMEGPGAAEIIATAVEVAKAAGKTRATKKHVAPKETNVAIGMSALEVAETGNSGAVGGTINHQSLRDQLVEALRDLLDAVSSRIYEDEPTVMAARAALARAEAA